jgi:hypothetical protein
MRALEEGDIISRDVRGKLAIYAAPTGAAVLNLALALHG